MTVIIDGKKISAAIREEIRAEVGALPGKPGLAVVLVGEDPASQVYVRNKKKACEEAGFYSEVYTLPAETPEAMLLELIAALNGNPAVHGILVQLPLPKHIDPEKVILAIDPAKDVDAFHPVNVGKILIGNSELLPCTPAGVMELLRRSGVPIAGKRCLVIGRSNIVGKPMAALLLHADGTVTVAHSKTQNLKELCLASDIIVSSVGKAGFLTGDMIPEGAAVIDVGINRDENGRLCGDVRFEEAVGKAAYITPVPGGVGPMTITMLLKNTLTAYRKTIR